jgi:hypothetical protein
LEQNSRIVIPVFVKNLVNSSAAGLSVGQKDEFCTIEPPFSCRAKNGCKNAALPRGVIGERPSTMARTTQVVEG